MELFGKTLGKDIVLIAEIGVNHEGSLDKAKELLVLAAQNGADAVKFQSYTPERFISSDDPERLARVGRFGLSKEDHYELKNLARDEGIAFFSSAISEDWVPLLAELGEVIKIASADITFKPVLAAAAKSGRKIILSTGGSFIEEVREAVSYLSSLIGEEALSDRLVLLHCISAYPTPIEEANLLSIPYLKQEFPNLSIGFSNHAKEREVVVAAVALGAQVIEVHFTDQKEGRDFHDHALSADADDLRYYSEILPKIHAARGSLGKTPQKCEREIVPIIRKGLIVNKDLSEGTILTEKDIHYARPSTGFLSDEFSRVIGKKLSRNLNAGQSLKPEHLAE